MAAPAMTLVRAQAQDLRPVHFSGVINDYSPSRYQAVRMKFAVPGRWT
jgi:hypothetical protein